MKTKKLVALILSLCILLCSFNFTAYAVEGDFNQDLNVSADDAIYLLYHVFFGDTYYITKNADFNHDGITNANDAIYLLYHVFFGEENYPLVEKEPNADYLDYDYILHLLGLRNLKNERGTFSYNVYNAPFTASEQPENVDLDRIMYVPEVFRIACIITLSYIINPIGIRNLDNANRKDVPSSYEGVNKIYGQWLSAYLYHLDNPVKEEYLSQTLSKADLARLIVFLYEKFHTNYDEWEYPDPIETHYIEPTPLNSDYINLIPESYIPHLGKAVTVGIIENNEELIDTTPITQKDMEDMFVKFAINYGAFIHEYGRPKIFTLVTDKSKLPSNADMYPYIISEIPNEIYEILSPIQRDGNPMNEKRLNPKELHLRHNWVIGEFFYTSKFLHLISNIDYRTIDEEAQKLYYTILYALFDGLYSTNRERLKQQWLDYVEYVKENEIIMSGTTKVLLPICYQKDFSMWYVRVKFVLNIEHSKTDVDLLFLSKGNKFIGNSMEFYVDIPIVAQYSHDFQETSINNQVDLLRYVVKGNEYIQKIK